MKVNFVPNIPRKSPSVNQPSQGVRHPAFGNVDKKVIAEIVAPKGNAGMRIIRRIQDMVFWTKEIQLGQNPTENKLIIEAFRKARAEADKPFVKMLDNIFEKLGISLTDDAKVTPVRS